MSLIYKKVFKGFWVILPVVLLLAGCASQPKPAYPPPETTEAPAEIISPEQPIAFISSIEVEEQEEFIRVIIKGSEPLTYEVTQMEAPLRLVVDVAGAQLETPQDTMAVNKGVVTEITPLELEMEGTPAIQIEVGLSKPAQYEVTLAENDLWVDFPKPPPVKPAENVFDFAINDMNNDFVQVDILADGTIEEYNFFDLIEPTRLVIDLPQLNSLLPATEKASISPLLKKVRCGEHPDYIRMVFDSPLEELPPFDVVPTSQGATVFFGAGFEEKKTELMGMDIPAPADEEPELLGFTDEPAETAEAEEADFSESPEGLIGGESPTSYAEAEADSEPTAAAEAETTPLETFDDEPVLAEAAPPSDTEEIVSPAPEIEADVSAEEKESKEEAVPAPAEISPFAATVIGGEGPVYTGTRISLDFKDADVRNILRLIADISDLNIVAGPDVQGSVTIKLQDVPWDQALDVILLSNGLGKTMDGNILRIAPIAQLEKERASAIAAQEDQIKLEPLRKGLIPVSYATAGEMQSVLKNAKVLSKRGTIEVDKRTNTLIVIDVEKNIEEVKEIVDNLDTPTPQVLIEAKIIQINPSYIKELGVRWHLLYGKFTDGSTFGIGGAHGIEDINTASPDVVSDSPQVDLLPAIGPGTGGGMSFGYAKAAHELYATLGALEKDEKLEIISSPRILTLDNEEAIIEQGTEIPYLEYAQDISQATIAFKKATLSLTVTPHVTADGSVAMEIEAKKDQVSAITDLSGGTGIDTRKAETTVLVRSGDTVVLGGIYEENNRDVYNNVPFFGRLPLLGYFFRNTSTRREKTELIIFITPTIVKIPKKEQKVVITSSVAE